MYPHIMVAFKELICCDMNVEQGRPHSAARQIHPGRIRQAPVRPPNISGATHEASYVHW